MGRCGQKVWHWGGLDWYGVPYPLRLWAWAFHPMHPKPSSFAGCGCLVELKRAVHDLRHAAQSLFTQVHKPSQ